ncbi:MAG: response regulator [Pseudomonadota bacterium]
MKMLIVDDSLVIRRKIEREIHLPGIVDIITATDGLDAIEKFKKHLPDLVTMDLTMPNLEGGDCVKKLMAIKPDTVILVISALADKATAITAIKNGAHGFLCKPFTEEALNSALNKLIDTTRTIAKRA